MWLWNLRKTLQAKADANQERQRLLIALVKEDLADVYLRFAELVESGMTPGEAVDKVADEYAELRRLPVPADTGETDTTELPVVDGE